MSLDFPWKTRRQFYPRITLLLDYFERKTLFQLSFFFPLIECEIGDRSNILDLTLYSERNIINIHILIQLIVNCNVYINIYSDLLSFERKKDLQKINSDRK